MDLERTLTVTAAIGSAAVGGVFFAFSAFVMPAMDRLPAPQGIAAMQSMNVTAVRPPLMIALFGTAVACAALVVRGATTWGDRRAVLLVVGGAVYVLGAVVVTGAFHVPRNDALALLDPDAAGSAAAWATYLSEWTAANHVRAASGLLGSAALLWAALD